MTVHVLGKDISLEDRALHGHPLPGIHGHPDAKGTHWVTGTPFGNICVEERGPSEGSVGKQGAIVGDCEFAVGRQLPDANRKARRLVFAPLKELLLKPEFKHPQGAESPRCSRW
jgi:hypothetical protein